MRSIFQRSLVQGANNCVLLFDETLLGVASRGMRFLIDSEITKGVTKLSVEELNVVRHFVGSGMDINPLDLKLP